jgi:hypothetical protein
MDQFRGKPYAGSEGVLGFALLLAVATSAAGQPSSKLSNCDPHRVGDRCTRPDGSICEVVSYRWRDFTVTSCTATTHDEKSPPLPITPIVRLDSRQSMTFVLSSDHDKIFAEGRFQSDTPKVFDEFVRQNRLTDRTGPRPVTVVLHSLGGRLISGPALGRAIRQFGFNTAVGRRSPNSQGGFSQEAGRCSST